MHRLLPSTHALLQYAVGIFGLCAAVLLASCTSQSNPQWNPGAAALYLDDRALRWEKWPPAARSQETVCVSCHTTLPYALARGRLAEILSEPQVPAPRRDLLANVLKRVRLWPHLPPYYVGQAGASRATEAVLNALILADEDAHHGHLSPATRAALDDMWNLQTGAGADSGSWPWIKFDNEPWEAGDSGYYGATLAALAVGVAPDDYREQAAIQPGLVLLRDYLVRAFPDQSLLSRIDLLWTAGHLPGLITPSRREALIQEIWMHQRADGGWALATLMPHWKRRDGRPQIPGSDGYATGFITLALQDSGVPLTDARLRRGLTWLASHQSSWNGRWLADSPNAAKGHLGTTRHFMDDAATAFAVLSLTESRTLGKRAARETVR
jgi:squalene-hopene/tetraprenyl-beta-curcumene cyclase